MSPDPEDIVAAERRTRDREAEVYEDKFERIGWEIAVEQACVESLLALRPGLALVDAGCGTGRHLAWLAQSATRVVGVDHSQRSLAVAAQRVPHDARDRVELHRADVRSLPLPDACVDRVLCNEVLQHLPTHQFRLQALREFHRVLRPGGLAVVKVYRWLGHIKWPREGHFEDGPYRYAFTARELRGLLREAGFGNTVLGGAVILPRLAQRVGMSVESQRRLAFTALGRHSAHYLVARGARGAGR